MRDMTPPTVRAGHVPGDETEEKIVARLNVSCGVSSGQGVDVSDQNKARQLKSRHGNEKCRECIALGGVKEALVVFQFSNVFKIFFSRFADFVDPVAASSQGPRGRKHNVEY